MNLTQILAELPKLSAADLAQVDKRIRLLKATRLSPSRKLDEDWLYCGIVTELKRRGLLRGFPEYIDKNYQQWSGQARAGLLHGVAGPELTPPELFGLGMVAARALADDLTGGPAPLCLKVMLQNTERLVGAFDKSFPDYRKCGMVGNIPGVRAPLSRSRKRYERTTPKEVQPH